MKKILIIEDDSDVRENISELLQLNGYCVKSLDQGSITLSVLLKKVASLI